MRTDFLRRMSDMSMPAGLRVHKLEQSLFAIVAVKMMWQVKVVVGFLVLLLRNSVHLLLRC